MELCSARRQPLPLLAVGIGTTACPTPSLHVVDGEPRWPEAATTLLLLLLALGVSAFCPSHSSLVHGMQLGVVVHRRGVGSPVRGFMRVHRCAAASACSAVRRRRAVENYVWRREAGRRGRTMDDEARWGRGACEARGQHVRVRQRHWQERRGRRGATA